MRYLIVIVSMNVIKYGFYYKVWGLYCTLVDLNFPYSQCHVVHFITFLFYKKATLKLKTKSYFINLLFHVVKRLQ